MLFYLQDRIRSAVVKPITTPANQYGIKFHAAYTGEMIFAISFFLGIAGLLVMLQSSFLIGVLMIIGAVKLYELDPGGEEAFMGILIIIAGVGSIATVAFDLWHRIFGWSN